MEQILMAFIFIFAVIGIITVAYSVIGAVYGSRSIGSNAELVMFVKDREEDIEGSVRGMYRAARSADLQPSAVVVVDCGSSDGTKKILDAIAREKELLKVCTQEEYIEYIKNKY